MKIYSDRINSLQQKINERAERIEEYQRRISKNYPLRELQHEGDLIKRWTKSQYMHLKYIKLYKEEIRQLRQLQIEDEDPTTLVIERRLIEDELF